jgi:hypothetical protein
MEKARKQGRRKLRRKIEEVSEDDDMPIKERIEQLGEQSAEYKEFMEDLLSKDNVELDGL